MFSKKLKAKYLCNFKTKYDIFFVMKAMYELKLKQNTMIKN